MIHPNNLKRTGYGMNLIDVKKFRRGKMKYCGVLILISAMILGMTGQAEATNESQAAVVNLLIEPGAKQAGMGTGGLRHSQHQGGLRSHLRLKHRKAGWKYY